MTSTGVDHWVASPYCFCKELPWLVLSALPPGRGSALLGGWGWEDWAILAATLIALAFLLFLLSLLACLLCPPGWCGACCGRGAKGGCCSFLPCCCCCSGGGSGGAKGKKEKKGLGTNGNIVEMSSIGGSEDTNLTAVDLKLPRAWMDASKGDMGDLGLGGGGGGYFGNQKTWNSANGDATAIGGGGYGAGGYGGGGGGYGGGGGEREINRSANLATHLRRSAHLRQTPYDVDSLDGAHEEDSSRTEVYRNQSTVTVIGGANIGEHIREAVQEWQKKSGLVSQKLDETRQQSRNECCPEQHNHHSCGKGGSCQNQHQHQHQQHQQYQQQMQQHVQGSEVKASVPETNNFGYSSVKESFQHESRYEEEEQKQKQTPTSSMALVKSSGSGAQNAMTTSGGSGGTPIVQCYTVTKKTTTTTFGDEEGDEETSVVTTTEKQWREGMNEVGEISVAAAATAGELLPDIGAPAHVLNDANNVRVVRSLTNVDGGVSNVVRRYEYQQTMKDTETLL